MQTQNKQKLMTLFIFPRLQVAQVCQWHWLHGSITLQRKSKKAPLSSTLDEIHSDIQADFFGFLIVITLIQIMVRLGDGEGAWGSQPYLAPSVTREEVINDYNTHPCQQREGGEAALLPWATSS